jgi:hypothetical protein
MAPGVRPLFVAAPRLGAPFQTSIGTAAMELRALRPYSIGEARTGDTLLGTHCCETGYDIAAAEDPLQQANGVGMSP